MLSTPTVLPSPALRLCRNGFSSTHFLAFLAANALVGVLFSWKRQRLKKACFEEEEGDECSSLLWHYGILWTAILTCPHGVLLDFYLFSLVSSDVGPFLAATIGVYRRGLIFNGERAEMRLNSEVAVMSVARVMYDYSPAFRLNALLLEAVNGDFAQHVFAITSFTVLITEVRAVLVRKFLCRLE